MASSNPAGSLLKPCVKCRAQEATLDSRSQAVCRDCFTKFIAAKCIKQIGLLAKETPTPHYGQPRRFVVGLSLGPCSAALVHLLNENVDFQLARSRPAPFTITAVYVDPHPARKAEDDILEGYRQRYPRFTFKRDDDDGKLDAMLNSLPSAASRSDIVRLLTRHILLAEAVSHDAQALLLGHSTTALAELTLAETAKGRGFSLPWVMRDGVVDVVVSRPPSSSLTSSPSPNQPALLPPPKETKTKKMLIYHPLRDALRKELITYLSLVDNPPPLLTTHIHHTADNDKADKKVVSHKDLSIDEVMIRYFADVEKEYPSVVANVARTTGKLVRLLSGDSSSSQKLCGLCGAPLDESGDERWRGELGIQIQEEDHGEGEDGSGSGNKKGGVCYGCERSVRG
ncbi:hypothetical protein QBC47DRAFT_352698 [Echria macrotheca]|uniref:Cytoplasmic tRNA 2-thiolation protein 2 n=1 Tax=Echria macrotheca TaxID=438768 RepID=A0AAJ0B2U7_9PEZI|nr:hypothetical protein QBC47DRAFT_352698 [Echria macrotheca]